MATATGPTTVADLLEDLGGIPARRVVWNPTPGTATERDLIELQARTNRMYELVDGTLVEKAMGFDESLFALFLSGALMDYLKTHAPFWKSEERAGGARWVEARQSDDAAADRWAPATRRSEAAQ